MASIIVKSGVPGKQPSASALEFGQLAVNYADEKIYFKNSYGNVVSLTTVNTSGTVTSVGGTGTVSGITLSGGVTSSGNLTLGGTLVVTPSNFASQSASTILAAPSGTAGTPTFRTLVPADIPTLNQNTTGSAGNVPWTGVTSKPTTLSGYGITDATPASHINSGGTSHSAVVAGGASGFMTGADKTKLDGIATSANNYVHPANHPASIITQDASNRFVTDTEKATWNAKQNALGFTPENITNKGLANGYASLDASGKVPSAQLPAYIDDVLEYANLAAFPVTGTSGIIYVALDTNKVYRWSGSAYIAITSGAVDSVAGKTGVVTLVKADVGLSVVDNTSDIDKPVSTAQQTVLNLKANIASPVFTGNVTGLGVATGTSFNSITGLASVAPLISGTAAIGTSTLAARQDHVHPTDTTRAATNQTMYIGTTAVTLNRASAALALTGITSIDGNAATVTNGIYSTGSYAEPAWLTSVNYNKLVGTIPTWNQNTTGSSNRIDSKDTRLVADTPQSFTRGLHADFKTNTTDGLADGGTFHGVLTFRQYSSASDWSGGGVRQLGFTDNHNLWIRGANADTTWSSWQKILHSGNYNTYAPTLTGTGATGTWGINITGNAATVASLSVHSGINNEPNKVVRTDVNGQIIAGYLNSAAGNEGNNTSPSRVWGTNGSDSYLRTYLTSALSVNYANSAGASASANYLSGQSTITYGTGKFQWTDISGAGGTGLSGSTPTNPSSDWYHHIILNHANAGGYYFDIAGCFHTDTLAFRRLVNGSLTPWRYTLHDGNIGTYAPTLTGTGATGTWGINITGNAANVTGIVPVANGGTGASTASSARTNLGATTIGSNLFTLTNPSAITFIRVNADNTLSTLDAPTFRTAIGAGTVTSVSGTGTVSGLSLSGAVTSTGALTLGGTLSVIPSNFSSQTANTFLAAPSGAAGVPTFRAIVAADIPILNQSTSGNAATATRLTNLTSTTTTTAGTDNTESCISYISSISLLGQTDGALYSHVYASTYKHNIYGDYRTGQIALRGKNNGVWTAWRTVLDSSNYNSYAPTLTGGGASGTWNINIIGGSQAVVCLDGDRLANTKLPTTSPNAVRYDFVNASTTGTGGTYAGVMTYAPYTGTTASTGDASYQLAFGSTATNGSGIAQLRIRNGIDSTWNNWLDILTSGNVKTINGNSILGTGNISITAGGSANPDTINVISTNTTASIYNTYICTAALTLTLPATPIAGAWLFISNRSSVNTVIVGRNGQKIMGLAEDMTLNVATNSVGIRLVYEGATHGWVLL
jgi:hypothetical protein